MQAIQMNVRIEPKIKTRLEREARRRGLSVGRYLNWLLEDTLPDLPPVTKEGEQEHAVRCE